MIVRLGYLVAASVAAYAVNQINLKISKPRDPLRKHSENGEASLEKCWNEEEDKEEEVKLINNVTNSALSSRSGFEDGLFPELGSLLSGEIEFPLPADKYDTSEKDKVYENEMANNGSGLERLPNLVKVLEDREVKFEGERLEYCGLKEQESSIAELQKQLKIKTVEIDVLNITINSLQTQRKKLQEEVSRGVVARKDLETARKNIKELQKQIQLQANQTKGQLLLLKQQVSGLQAKEEEAFKKDAEDEKKLKTVKELEEDIMELKRKNKELQHEKRELIVKLDAAEANIQALSNMTESEMVAKAREEVSNLRHTKEDLIKQMEGLQMNRFGEVEELVYLRWANACLRFELRNYQTPSGKISARDLSKSLSPRSQERVKQLMLEYAGSGPGGGDTDTDSNFSEDFENVSVDSLSKKPSLMQKLKRWGKSKDDSSVLSSPTRSSAGGSPRRASMSHRPTGPLEVLMLRNAGDSVAITSFGTGEQDSVAVSFHLMSKSVEGGDKKKYPEYKDRQKLALEREKQIKEKAQQARAAKSVTLPPKLALIKEKSFVPGHSSDLSNDKKVDSQIVTKMKLIEIEKRAPRVPRPPPKPSGAAPSGADKNASSWPPGAPPVLPSPPPGGPPQLPPPPGSLSRAAGSGEKVHRAPELVEFYQTLMKREGKKDTPSLISTSSNTSDARNNMIGEIENQSSFLLAVKADVETQGDFVQSLATEIRAASFTDIEDVVAFVNWLDEELSFLVDDGAVLKHFDWPEGKADAFREAAFEYQDLTKLEKQVSSFTDDPNLPCEASLKKIYMLLERVEQSVYALLRTRVMTVSRYTEFGIPVGWLLDSGIIGKIKLSSVQLARKYMKRVASELDAMNEPEKEPNKEFLILQGVRFAFRVHQFAGGFDADSMKAFEELRSRASTLIIEENKSEA